MIIDTSPIKVGILDDHPMIAAGLEMMLNDTSDIIFCGLAQTEEELFAMVETQKLGVAILDIRLPGVNGLHVCRRLYEKYPATRVLILTSVFEEPGIKAAFSAGAKGYALKNISFQLLPLAIRQVHGGGIYLAPEIASRAAGLGIRTKDSLRSGLSEREHDIIRLIAEGKTNKEVAISIGVSYHTVKFYVSRLLKEHGYQTRAQLLQLLEEL